MLQIQFIKKFSGLMRAAVDEAKIGGEIVNTKWRELNGDLYLKIPDEEVQPWLDLLEDLALDVNEDYYVAVQRIKDLCEDSGFKSVGEGREGEKDGHGAERGATSLAPGESSGCGG